MKKHKFIFLLLQFIFFVIFFNEESFAQEKKVFLQNRFYEYNEVITKNYTKEKLLNLIADLKREGITFTFSNLKFDKNKEIIRIKISLKNNISNSELSLNNKKPIPNVKIGEINGITAISTALDAEIKFSKNNSEKFN